MQASAFGRSGASAPSFELTQRHREDVERAVARARAAAAPCLLRTEVTLNEHDLIGRYASLALTQHLPFIFKRPRHKLTIVAWGAIEVAHGAAARRFEAAVEHCSRVRELDMVGSSVRTPLWVGGAAFAPLRSTTNRPAAEAWSGWPDARFSIPRVMLLADDDGARVVVSTWVRPADERDAIIAALTTELDDLARTREARLGQAAPTEPGMGRNAWSTLENEEAWAKRVDAACDVIASGQLDKVVLARAIRLTAPRGSAPDVLRTLTYLVEHHAGSTCFVVGNDDHSYFVGATPETLLALDDGWIETHALAGTAPRGSNTREDDTLAAALIASAKNREEHDVVAHALRARLAARCTMLETSTNEPRLVKLARVQHLETTLRGKLASPAHVLTLASELHPTPAVGGSPAAPALRYLTDNEPLERGWYSGPLGVIDARGEGTLVVAIRSMLVRGDTAWAFAGGGIVAASNARDEWRETELKLAGITDAVCVTAVDANARQVST